MGVETFLILGMKAFQASQQMKQGRAEAKAIIEQADIESRERAKRTRALAGRQKVSFLNSGLTLEGTPMAAIQETFKTGMEDINLSIRNAERGAKSAITKSRTEAIGTLAGTLGSSSGIGDLFTGSFGSTFDIAGDLKGVNIPFTGQKHSFSQGGTIMPPRKPTRINF